MILPIISLKKCFVLILGSALLLLFGFHFSNFEGWYSKTSNLQSHPLTINETHRKIDVIEKKVSHKHYDYVLRREPSYSETIKSIEWYFYNDEIYTFPTSNNSIESLKLFPGNDSRNDRIKDQLMFVPHNYQQIREHNSLKTILLYNGLESWDVADGREVFLYSKCPVDTCTFTSNKGKAVSADLIVYTQCFAPMTAPADRPSHQLHMLYTLECPLNTGNFEFPSGFNWTATYRKDSDIVLPYYGKWEYYDNNIKQMNQYRNYALNKTKKVAWFVSNCRANNGRLQYAHALQKYIDVDIYGACGTLKCSRSIENKCFEILDQEYKFYLAFENSNCKDYITEKLIKNALKRNILPIVMGAPPEDYENTTPYRSYIHVDEFASAKELADYLNILDKDDEAYNSYFKWKGTGEFINTFFWCRVCAVLHDDLAIKKPKWYRNINSWWKSPGGCIRDSWRNLELNKTLSK